MHGIGRLFLFLSCGVILFALYLSFLRNIPVRISFDEIPSTTSNSASPSAVPKAISMPSLGILLPVFSQQATYSSWEDTKEGISYLSSSGIPGKTGNAVFYGHNYPSLLGPLPHITPGNWIDLLYNDGTIHRYKVTFTSVVTPDQTHILEQTDDIRITVYTCTGFFDSKRFVTVAEFYKTLSPIKSVAVK